MMSMEGWDKHIRPSKRIEAVDVKAMGDYGVRVRFFFEGEMQVAFLQPENAENLAVELIRAAHKIKKGEE
jgi:hypothetical protein